MAGESGRSKDKRRKPRLSPAQMVRPGMNETAETPVAGTSTNAAGQKADLREEYGYVIADLERIGLIALAMLAVLIGLALLLS